ncbi:MAG: hypothetical protein DMG09_16760 [Acidobacteria bacterium]|nr:MAG: hypothetical protein DMG09_16760 [Acidobacteriota bacterium]
MIVVSPPLPLRPFAPLPLCPFAASHLRTSAPLPIFLVSFPGPNPGAHDPVEIKILGGIVLSCCGK